MHQRSSSHVVDNTDLRHKLYRAGVAVLLATVLVGAIPLFLSGLASLSAVGIGSRTVGPAGDSQPAWWSLGSTALAQTGNGFDLDWNVVAGGGGESDNGFTLRGTAGQHGVLRSASGDGFSLRGGFWRTRRMEEPPERPKETPEPTEEPPEPTARPVGGYGVSESRWALLAPWVGLATAAALVVVAGWVWRKRMRVDG